MNKLRNRVNLIGNLGRDPEIKEFENGKKVAKMVMATNEVYRNGNGEKVTETQWHNLVAWEKKAVYAENFLKKGSEVAIEGKLVHRSYEGQDGTKKYITEIVVSDMLMFGAGKPENAE